METQEPISAAAASAALVSVRHSRTRVAWAGYPAWYWYANGAGLAALSSATLLPTWLGLVGIVVVAGFLLRVNIAAGRTRGVCESWTRSAMRWWEVVALYGPVAVLLLAGAVGAKYAWWPPAAASVLVFLLFAGTGLKLSARAARR